MAWSPEQDHLGLKSVTLVLADEQPVVLKEITKSKLPTRCVIFTAALNDDEMLEAIVWVYQEWF